MRDDENKKLGEAPDEEKENKDEKSSENNAENKDDAPSQNGKGKKPFADLAQRLITAVFIAVLYVGFILLSFLVDKHFYDALVVLLMVLASFEFVRAISLRFPRPIEIFAYINIVVGYVAFKAIDTMRGSGGITSFFGVLALTFIACIVFNMFSKKHTISNVISTLFVLIYPVAIMTYLLALNYLGEHSHVAILFAFGVTTLVDSMAYFVGSIVRGPKLCPTISPKKTISGAIGGLLGGLLGGYIISVFAQFNFVGCVPIYADPVANILNFLFLGLGTSVFCQIGDLISSYIKRACGIKDFGKILKGHGGFMDRIDGVIIAAVFIFIFFNVLRFVVL
ncbi:MAG: phosphatidate cytidylyltransferase [Clostridia bacterium]|nr:phosphatidate cytidylyltransferase [Clostridia bacterium]